MKNVPSNRPRPGRCGRHRDGFRFSGRDRDDLDDLPARPGLSRGGRHSAGARRGRALRHLVPQPDARRAARIPTAAAGPDEGQQQRVLASVRNLHRLRCRPRRRLDRAVITTSPSTTPSRRACCSFPDRRSTSAAPSASGSPAPNARASRSSSRRKALIACLTSAEASRSANNSPSSFIRSRIFFARAGAQQALRLAQRLGRLGEQRRHDSLKCLVSSPGPARWLTRPMSMRLIDAERLRRAADSARRGGGRQGAAAAASWPLRGPARGRRTAARSARLLRR